MDINDFYGYFWSPQPCSSNFFEKIVFYFTKSLWFKTMIYRFVSDILLILKSFVFYFTNSVDLKQWFIVLLSTFYWYWNFLFFFVFVFEIQMTVWNAVITRGIMAVATAVGFCDRAFTVHGRHIVIAQFDK